MRRLVALSLLLAACRSAAPAPDATPATAAAAPVAPVLTLGAVPLGDAATRRRQLAGLARHLEGKLGGPVELGIAESYRAFSQGLAEQRWDLVLLGSVLYSRVHETGYDAAAVAVRGGDSAHHGILVARAGGPVATPADLKGRRVAFVVPYSASGFEFPFAFLYAQGLRPGDYAREFLGTHDAVVRAVLEGRFDVGATYEGALDELLPPGRRGELTIIGRTDPIPGEVFALRRGGPHHETVRAALLELHLAPDAREVLAPLHADRLEAPAAGLFDGARAIDLLVTEAAGL